jgi:hypothetical protein
VSGAGGLRDITNSIYNTFRRSKSVRDIGHAIYVMRLEARKHDALDFDGLEIPEDL